MFSEIRDSATINDNHLRFFTINNLKQHLPADLYQRVLARYSFDPEQTLNGAIEKPDMYICPFGKKKVFSDTPLAIVLQDKKNGIYKHRPDPFSGTFEQWKPDSRFTNSEYLLIIKALLAAGADPNVRIPHEA